MTEVTKFTILLLVAVTLIILLLIAGPLPQPQWYHNFADKRMVWLIPNFYNVVTNGIFLIVGIIGVFYLKSPVASKKLCFKTPQEKWFYFIFFLATLFVSVGSSYYHWQPENATLVYDRLPMTIAFMSLFTAIIAERINRRAGLILLPICTVLGLATIFYWQVTQDLRPYIFVQFYPMLAIPLMLLMYRPSYSGVSWLWFALLLYFLAKVTETFDGYLYHLTAETISGHSLKHILAGFSCWFVLLYLQKRHLMRLDVDSNF
ncbi:MAG: hypothetical protein A3F10_00550 [Coxiella sp. RIFCSPHIGHO2_12_FULL_42_15]|nr:MAG: hypothetical protein A3F10_00550 [Coxiella sp. RIFCSPHIGHO2_12_FULL_42_15]